MQEIIEVTVQRLSSFSKEEVYPVYGNAGSNLLKSVFYSFKQKYKF